ncbi:MAG TPA: hypothetical protein VK492_04490 [Chitinophagaceae bacterium]|nr:hypothetical protein [Chitinophagaceae bacterium]
MGYDLHIIRKNNWDDFEEESNITLDEWLKYINTDSELELTDGYDIKIGQEQYFQNRPGYCEWNAHPKYKDPNNRPWFAYWKGDINTKNPDYETIYKMLSIARQINAKVQGDDGEYYDEKYLSDLMSKDHTQIDNKAKTKRAWWKFW